jgi:hypothetical protein
MFSLIIAILSIALVAALAVATIYYGGPAYQKSQAQAQAARVLNEGLQLDASLTLYRNQTGMTAATFEDVVSAGYLSSIPEGWQISEGYTFRAEPSEDACLAANKKQGVDLVPECTDTAYADRPICCSDSSSS